MVKKEIIGIKETLLNLFQRKGIKITKIAIFGSYAKGKQKEDSDIDIIIVSPDFRNKDNFEKVKLTRGVHRKLVDRTKKPIDIMYYSDLEWNRGHSLIINAAKREGKIIYG